MKIFKLILLWLIAVGLLGGGCVLLENDKHVHYHFCPKKPYKIYYRPIYVDGKPLNGGFALPPREYPQYYYRIRVYHDGRTELDTKQRRTYNRPYTLKNGWYTR
jgi:hypothetical protein